MLRLKVAWLGRFRMRETKSPKFIGHRLQSSPQKCLNWEEILIGTVRPYQNILTFIYSTPERILIQIRINIARPMLHTLTD
jgi:hypothetical protein